MSVWWFESIAVEHITRRHEPYAGVGVFLQRIAQRSKSRVNQLGESELGRFLNLWSTAAVSRANIAARYSLAPALNLGAF